MSLAAKITVLAALLVFAGTPASAQSHPLVGVWNISYQRGLSNEDGVVTPIMGKGRLEISLKGDSLIATLSATDNPGGPARPPLRLAGVAEGPTATLAGTSSARINMNGDEQVVQTTLTWTLSVNGGALTGTMIRAIPGHETGGDPSPVTGTREK
jgi:hypothetical protein